MRHVFIASLGGAPQVITETLWAMMHPELLIGTSHENRPKVIPHVVHILATSFLPHDSPHDTLRQRDNEIHDKINELFDEYRHPRPAITIEMLSIDGEPQADVRTQSQNVAYANQITRIVREYKSDPNTAVHMSLAGGRKSMSSYDQSAMMFFCNLTNDTLTHVLVEPEALERSRDFWWPDQKTERVTVDGKDYFTHVKAAHIDLVDVPFVSLNLHLPGGAPEAEDYQSIVDFAQFEARGDKVVIDAETKTVKAGKETIELGRNHFSYLALLAIARQGRWSGAGPEEEGIGANSAGFLLLDDIRYGRADENTARSTDAIEILRALRDHLNTDTMGPDEDQQDWIARIDECVFLDPVDPTMSMRSRTATAIREATSNIYMKNLLVPTSYGRARKAVIGLPIPPERIELRGFPEGIVRSEQERRFRTSQDGGKK